MFTFWLSERVVRLKSWPMFMSRRSLVAIGFRFPLFLTEMFGSPPVYGKNSTRNWAQGCISELHIIRRPTAKVSELYRPLRICCEHVLLILVAVGIPTYLLQSSPTTIVIAPSLVFHLLSSCMVEDVVPQFVGERLVIGLWERPK